MIAYVLGGTTHKRTAAFEDSCIKTAEKNRNHAGVFCFFYKQSRNVSQSHKIITKKKDLERKDWLLRR